MECESFHFLRARKREGGRARRARCTASSAHGDDERTDDGRWMENKLFVFIHPSVARPSVRSGSVDRSSLFRSGRPSGVGAPRDRSSVIHPSIHAFVGSPTLFSTRRRRPFSFYIPLRVVIVYPSGPRLFFTDWWFNPASSDVDDVRERCDVKLTDPL